MVSFAYMFCFVSALKTAQLYLPWQGNKHQRDKQQSRRMNLETENNAPTPLYSSRATDATLSTIKQSNIPQIARDIKELSAQNMLEQLNFFGVSVPSYISSTAVPTSYIKTICASKSKGTPPLVLLHGFDSSCLEFRRLAPLIAEYADVYVPDILGWGFSDVSEVKDFSPTAKLEHLKCFLEQVVGEPCVLVGASLGGAIAINMAVNVCPELVSKLVLIDGQGFIDGKGPSSLPEFFARMGVNILKSNPLRQYANFISYADKKFVTDDAVLIGRAHCMKETWERASINFLLSGGFTVSPYVPKVQQQTLVLWGREDKILAAEFAERFQQTLPSNKLMFLEQCGHVPHLEKPIDTADFIRQFIGL